MATIETNDRVKIHSSSADKDPIGFVTPGVLGASIGEANRNILGSYSQVLALYNVEPSPIPDNSYVLGDNRTHVFEFKSTGDFTIDPESDTYNGFGESTNWIDRTVRESLRVAIDNKTSFVWNADIAPLLVHPVSMYGSDGQLYNSVSGGNLADDPINGNTANWQLFLDPTAGIFFAGSEMHIAVSTLPSGWIAQDGAAYAKTLYPALYQFLKDGTNQCIYGDSDPGNDTVGTFNVPDMRALVVRGWNNGRSDIYADSSAAGVNITGTLAAASTEITAPSSLIGLEEGMLLSGTGITAGTRIERINWETTTITMTLAAAAPGTVNIACISRQDRGDGVNGDNVGTNQLDATLKHVHSSEGDIQSNSGGTNDWDAGGGGGERSVYQQLSAESGSDTETRMKNQYKQFIIFTGVT